MHAPEGSESRARTRLALAAAVLLALIAPLYFVNGLAIDRIRIVQLLEDPAHIAYFALAAWLTLQQSPRLRAQSFAHQTVLLSVGAVLIGSAIELLQSLTGGDAEVGDVLRDLLGVLLTLAFLAPARHQLRLWLRRAAQAILVCALLYELYPVGYYLLDYYHARRDFPVLADFETCCEVQRWTRGTIVTGHARHGHRALRIGLDTGSYSGDTLKELIGNWQGYRALRFSIFNPGPGTLRITMKIFDAQHIANGQPYDDRFNGRYTLHEGWNNLSIPLDRIARAPKTRRMDLTRIMQFGFFVRHLPAPRTIYFDDLRLVH